MIATEFHNYQTTETTQCIGGRCSPGLLELRTDLEARWGLLSLGCYGPRAVRGGTAASSHTWGAAIDLSYGTASQERQNEMCGYLVAWSLEWGVQAIHDYRRSRIWRAGRTTNPADACTKWWKAQRPDSNGMGQLWATWLHIEVHPDRWSDGTSAADRGIL